MITITITAKDADEALLQVIGLVRKGTVEKAVVTETPDPEPNNTQPETPTPAPVEETAAESAPIKKESGPADVEVRSLLNDVRTKKGPKALRAILDEVGYRSFPQIPTDKYPELVNLANAALSAD